MAEALEDRRLLTAPVIDPIANVSVPSGKSLVIPVTGSTDTGFPLTYSVQSNGAPVAATVYKGTIDLKISVQNYGDMIFQLLPEIAPNTVNQMVGLVNRNPGYFNGLTFHRVVPNFVIQGGDPNGNGSGGPGFSFDDEFNPEAIFSGNGQLAMANSGKDTNGSQFFVTVGPQRFLDFNHTIWGQLVRGFDVLQAIDSAPNSGSPNNRPLTPIVITSASIVPDSTDTVLIVDSKAAGGATITVTADDGQGGVTSRSFQATTVADGTNDPPILGPVGNQVTARNVPIAIPLTSVDLEKGAVTYAADVLDPVDPTDLKPLATVTPTATGVTVTPKAGFVGTIHLLVKVKQAGATTRGSDTKDPYDEQAITLTVKDQTFTNSGVPANVTEGAPITTPVAHFTPSLPFTAANFTATIAWGDGTTTTGTVTAAAGGGYDVGANNKVYTRAGSRAITVTVLDNSTLRQTTIPGTVNVADAPLSARFVGQIQPSGTLSGAIANVTDGNPTPNLFDLSASIDWGDGTTSPGTISGGAGGALVVSGTKTYGALGQYKVKVTVTDVGGATASAEGMVTLANRAPTLADIGPKSVTEGARLAFRVTGSDPDAGQTLSYSLAPGAPAGASIDPSTGDFSWTPPVAGTNPTITVIATDSGSPAMSVSKSFAVDVADVAPSVDLGAAATLTQFDTLSHRGQFGDPGAGTWTATVDYGDGSGVQTLALNADRTFTLSHSYASAGNFVATVVVRDEAGLTGTASLPVGVAARPTVGITSARANKTKKAVSSITMTLNGPIDPTAANDASSFVIAAAGRDRKLGTRDDVITRFRSATYDAAARTITLTPARRLVLSAGLQLRVTGLRDMFGRSIDGATSGVLTAKIAKSGTISVASVKRSHA